MVEIMRNTYSVIVYDETQERGIAFPASKEIEIQQFVEELKQIANSDEIEAGTRITGLVFEDSCRPMKEFLEDKQGREPVLDDDKQAKELYNFYYKHSMPMIGPGIIQYVYMGKEYIGIKVEIL